MAAAHTTGRGPAATLALLLIGLSVLLLQGCAMLAPRGEAPASHVLADATDSSLGRRVAQAARSAAPGESGFRLLPDGRFSLDARLALIRHAEKSLDLQYFLFRGDEVGAQLLRELRAAAERGVRIRLLVDDLHLDDDDELMHAFARFPNVSVRLFNPLPARGGKVATRLLRSLTEVFRINHRMHNKLLVADNSLSVSGGRNIGKEYFMNSAEANFIDMDVVAAGPIVQQQSQSFDRYWNSAHAYPVHSLAMAFHEARGSSRTMALRFEELTAQPPLALQGLSRDLFGQQLLSSELATQQSIALAWAPAEAWDDDPDKIVGPTRKLRIAGSVTEKVLGLIRQAQSSVTIISPYFIPGPLGLDIMRDAQRRGVRTTVLTNSLGASDEALVYFAYARYREQMLRLDVRLFELSPSLSRRLTRLGNFGRSQGRLHAKMAIIDGQSLVVGSLNMDGRSACLNTESVLRIDSPALVDTFLDLQPGGRFRGAYEVRLAPAGGLQWIEHEEDGSFSVLDAEPDTGPFTPLGRLIAPLLPEDFL